MAIAMRYNKSTWREAKSVNKSRLLATVGLPQPATINGNKVPLFGVVTRLVHQKGLQVNGNRQVTVDCASRSLVLFTLEQFRVSEYSRFI